MRRSPLDTCDPYMALHSRCALLTRVDLATPMTPMGEGVLLLGRSDVVSIVNNSLRHFLAPHDPCLATRCNHVQALSSLKYLDGPREAQLRLALVLVVVLLPRCPMQRIHSLWLILLFGSNMGVTTHQGNDVATH